MVTSRDPLSRTWLLWAVLAAAVLQAVAPVASFLAADNQPGSSGADLAINPAGYAFSIWGLIYLLSLVLAAVTVARGKPGVDRAGRFQLDLLGAYLAAVAWIGVSAIGLAWATALVLIVMTLLLLDAAIIAAKPVAQSDAVTLLSRATTGIYAAWVTVAVFLNLASAAVDLGWLDDSEIIWQLVVLVVAVLAALGMTALIGASSPGYPLTLIWAFVGVIVASWNGSTAVVVAAIVAIAAVVLVQSATLVRR